MSLVLKTIAVLLVIASVAVVVHGFITGAWIGGLIYAAIAALVLHQWWTSRSMSDEARAVVDRMFVAVVVVLFLSARPALDSLETLASTSEDGAP